MAMTITVVVPGVAAVPSVMVTAVPSTIVPGIIVPRIVEPWIIPSAVPSVVVIRTIIPRVVPAVVVVRTIVPRVVPASVVPRAGAPVQGRVVGTVPRLVGSPGVPTGVVEVNRCGVLSLVDIYLGDLVIRDEQGIDSGSALHVDGGTFRLRDKQVGLLLEIG